MNDLADTIDDLICSFESDGKTMDTLIMYLFCWAIVGMVALAVGKFVYSKIVGCKGGRKPPVSTKAAEAEAAVLGGDRKRVVPPTPPTTRKRLGSKSGRTSAAVASVTAGLSAVPAAATANKVYPSSSANDLRVSPSRNLPSNRTAPMPPAATGHDADAVRWVNDLFRWLYSDPSAIEYLLGQWIISLNEYTKKSFAEHGVGVELVRFLPENHVPTFSNIFCELGVHETITITCDCDAMPAMQLKAMRQKGDKVDVSHYRVNVNKLQARMTVICDTPRKKAEIKFDGWPKVKIILAQVGTIKSNTLDEVQLQDVIMDIVTGAIRCTNLSLDMYQWTDCPTFKKTPEIPISSPLDSYDDRTTVSRSTCSQGEKRLMVKVIKAVGIGLKQVCYEPYCVIEVDDPFQKKQTGAKKNTSSPQWNENFIFTLNKRTEEILFEIYDCNSNGEVQFMGLAIVSVEELLVNPCQRQVLSLQSRPYQNDSVSGTLTLEFIFLEDEPQKNLRQTTEFYNERSSMYNDHYAQESFGISLNRNRPQSPHNTINREKNTSYNTNFHHNDYNNTTTDNYRSSLADQRQVSGNYYNGSPQSQDQSNTGISVERRGTIYENAQEDRGRSRKKKRDFLGAMRTRFNRSKFRSKSIDASDQDAFRYGLSPGQARSISADGSRNSPTDMLAPPRAGSTRSSLSEMSGASGTSTGTYLNEASTLVLETIENNVKKHYLVPFTLASKRKWKRAGVKLHIFNEHTFVAKHLSSRLACLVCAKYFPRRIGKQGYECRDCLIKCHKECHVKIPNQCTNSRVQNIDLNNLTVLSSM
ncbi:uncharacterized protein LOC126899654 [Daktulosphaira vitifoliae]|uniref:uncharacterized protein LOC126899654 n=1 Tax=Daktulosphaira vitifoliae TaxID=58002 RepID=UPI0021AA736A|nr:uncharacterized protein LOC126899654 [Daktulosphaira vitifoliae]